MKAALLKKSLKSDYSMYLMLLPGIILIGIYCYVPMFGVAMAFQNYIPAFGILKSKWVGLYNFRYILELPDTFQILWNTFYIATMKVILGNVSTIIMALLLNEVAKKWLKRTVQTIIYLPFFLSWVILGGLFRDIFNLDGIVNQFLGVLHIQPVMFLGDNNIFPYFLVITDTWKGVGFGAIVYLAAISNIVPTLYEAAIMDGAGKLRQTWHITLPGMRPIIVLMATLSLGGILNAGFDQIFNLYSPMVYKSADIIDTYVYRAGLVNAQYSLAAAVGLAQSLVSLILISASYYLAKKYADYRIF